MINRLKLGFIFFVVLLISGCDLFFDESNSDFDYSPLNYYKAEATPDVDLPEYIAMNIKKEPIYPIDFKKKLKGEVKVSKVPPTLEGKIYDYDS